jgi:hypothetical protein
VVPCRHPTNHRSSTAPSPHATDSPTPDLTPQQRAERGNWVGCIAGALSFAEYEQDLADAGSVDIQITPAHEVTAGMYSAVVKARKPGNVQEA